MTLLAVGGYAEAGKDAFVDVLEYRFGYERTFMSKPLMNALLILDPWIHLERRNPAALRYKELHRLVGYAESKKEPEVRRLLQILGTEIGRTFFGDDAWINLILQELDTKPTSSWAITGVRYHNELEALKERGMVSVWIHRPEVLPVNSHSSDNTLTPADFDHQIANDGSLVELGNKADQFHRRLNTN